MEELNPLRPMEFGEILGTGWRLTIGSCYWNAVPHHLVRKSYEGYFKGQRDMDRPTWDQLRVLYACRPGSRDKFEVSAAGDMGFDEAGLLRWTPVPNRGRAYAYVKDMEAVRAELTELMMHEPARWGR